MEIAEHEFVLDDILDIAATEDPHNVLLEDDIRHIQRFEGRERVRQGTEIVTSITDYRDSRRLDERKEYANSLATSIMAEEEIVLDIVLEEYDHIMKDE